jgi:hypothetical protein
MARGCQFGRGERALSGDAAQGQQDMARLSVAAAKTDLVDQPGRFVIGAVILALVEVFLDHFAQREHPAHAAAFECEIERVDDVIEAQVFGDADRAAANVGAVLNQPWPFVARDMDDQGAFDAQVAFDRAKENARGHDRRRRLLYPGEHFVPVPAGQVFGRQAGDGRVHAVDLFPPARRASTACAIKGCRIKDRAGCRPK